MIYRYVLVALAIVVCGPVHAAKQESAGVSVWWPGAGSVPAVIVQPAAKQESATPKPVPPK
jgi:hypothetical protein